MALRINKLNEFSKIRNVLSAKDQSRGVLCLEGFLKFLILVASIPFPLLSHKFGWWKEHVHIIGCLYH